MPGKRTVSIAAALITLTSVIAGGEQSTAEEAEQGTFVEILASPDRDPGGPNGGCVEHLPG